MSRVAIWIALGLGSGLIRPAPGTWGSLAAVILGYILYVSAGPWAILVAAVSASILGIWAAQIYQRETGKSDASEVVIDEWAGQWIALLPAVFLAPESGFFWLAAFGLFRLFDIIKIGPVGWADRTLKGGLGVMADDILAGLFAAAVLWLIWVGFYG